MGNIFYFDWEADLIAWLQQAMGSAGEAVSRFFSFVGGETVTLVVLIAVLFCYKKEAGKRCAVSIIAAGMWCPMIKNIALRLRPYMAHPEKIKALSIVHPDADPMDILQQGFSFPSGHSATAVSVYGSLAREVKKRWMWCLAVIVPLLVGLSRFAVGVHYPTDVLAGWLVGILAVCFGTRLEKKIEKEWVRHLILALLTVPGIFWCSSRDYFTALGLLIGMIVVFPYETKYIRFQDTRNIWAMILRVAGAFALYAGLNKALKLPFSKEYLDSGILGANLIRSARYAIIIFAMIGVYPRCFPIFEKIGKRNR